MTPVSPTNPIGFGPQAAEGISNAATASDPLPHTGQIAIDSDAPVLTPEMLQSEGGRAVLDAFVAEVLHRVQTQAIPWAWTIEEFCRFTRWPELRVWHLIANDGLPVHKVRRAAPGQREGIVIAFEFFAWVLSQPKCTPRKFQRRRDEKETALQQILSELKAGNETQPQRRMPTRKSA